MATIRARTLAAKILSIEVPLSEVELRPGGAASVYSDHLKRRRAKALSLADRPVLRASEFKLTLSPASGRDRPQAGFRNRPTVASGQGLVMALRDAKARIAPR